MIATASPHDLQLLLNAEHPDPFGFLGQQEANGQLVVRAFRPDAKSLTIVDRNDQKRRRGLCCRTHRVDVGHRSRLLGDVGRRVDSAPGV